MEPFKIGRYQVTAEIGLGGMSTVYRAYDSTFERDVAIKVLSREFLHDPTFRSRFIREAKIIAALEHAAIVPVHDFGEEDGQPYLVMRLMAGGSLQERIRAGRISLAETVRIINRIGPALDEAHRKGVIHRDLKPANILFDLHNEPFLADFGIARLMTGPTLTSQYATVGTPAYMSPEQGRGDPDVDGQSDIYSLGSILFEMLSGRVPYEAETPTGQIIKHITDPVPNILALCADLPPGCQALINRAMAKKKTDRFTTVAEMAQMLDAISQGNTLPSLPKLAVESAPPTAVLPPPPPAHFSFLQFFKRFPVWLWILIGILSLLACLSTIRLAGILVLFQKPAPTPTYTAAAPSSTPWVTDRVVPSFTSTLEPSPSATPTSSPTASPTVTRVFTISPTPEPSYTPTPFVAVVKVDVANVRAGPGFIFLAFTQFNRDTALQVIGRNTDGTWLLIQLPDQAKTGWIYIDTVTVGFDIMLLPEVEAPPTPTPALAEATPAPTRRSGPTKTPTRGPYP
jgi:serine/threonine protein kinase